MKDGAYLAPVDGIYLRKGPGEAPIAAVVETGMDGTLIDPAAVVDPLTRVPIAVTSMGIERDGFRGDAFAINVSTAGTGGNPAPAGGPLMVTKNAADRKVRSPRAGGPGHFGLPPPPPFAMTCTST